MTSDIGLRIKEVRGTLTQAAFAGRLGVKASYISLIEKGKRTPSGKITELISVKFGVNKTWLLTGEGSMGRGAGTGEFGIPGAEPAEVVPVPVFALAGAGPGKDLFTGAPLYFIHVLKRFFKVGMNALLVSGNSMEPTIMDGAYALVMPGPQEVVDNKIYIVYLRDNGVVLKRLFRGPGKLLLRSDNQAFPEMEADPKDIVIQGRVVGTMQEF